MKINKSEDKVIVRHHQTIRQSSKFQTTEVSYGIELVSENSDSAIHAASKRAEKIVEKRLASKIKQQSELLEALAESNGH
jgi:competence CoiA-like predicted nuclease